LSKTVYMMVTRDKYSLPEAIADSVKDLAQLVDSTSGSILSTISHDKKQGRLPKYIKVEIPED